MSAGQTMIAAEYEGTRAARALRVVPDYHGVRNGDHIQTGCAEEGDWRGICRESPSGEIFTMMLSQHQTRDSLTGTADLGDPQPITGTIATSGHLSVEATYLLVSEDVSLEVTLTDWQTPTVNMRVTGRFSLTIRAPGVAGFLRLDTEFRVVSTTSTVPLAGRRDGTMRRGLLQALKSERNERQLRSVHEPVEARTPEAGAAARSERAWPQP